MKNIMGCMDICHGIHIIYIYTCLWIYIYNIYIYILVNCVCNGMDINLETSLEWNDDH